MKSSKLLSIVILLSCATQSFGLSGRWFSRLFSRANIICSFVAATIVAGLSTDLNDNTVSSNIFSRKKMMRDHFCKGKVEGYWASHPDPSKDRYHGRYPWPEANSQPWPGQVEFSDILAKIEKILEKSPEGIIQYKGLSMSRFEPNRCVGSREFKWVDSETKEVIRWPKAFRIYYVDQFNVKPSEEFYKFITSRHLLA